MARSRRGRGEGSIYEREDGLWCANISVGYSDSGKRRRKTVYGKTKKEAQEKLRKLATECAAGKPLETQKVTLGEYLDRWLKTIKQNVAPSTYDRYKTAVTHQVKPYLGGVRLSRVEPVHIEQLYVDLAEKGCSPRSIQLAGVGLVKALQHAVTLRLIGHNPARGIAKPKVTKAEMKVWEPSQVSTFLKSIEGDRLEALYLLALTGGPRQGELFGLQWPDINFTAGHVIVQRSLEEIRGKLRLKDTKTGRGRKIDLPKMTLDALKRHQAKMLAEGHLDGPVFCDGAGGHLRKGNVYRRSFKPLVEAAGLPLIRFHDLRHTHATLLLQAGENVKVVSERLGHANIKITLDTYAHILPTMQKAAADKMQQLLG